MNTSIRTRLTVAFLILALLPLLVAAAINLSLLYRYALDISFDHLQESAGRVASQVERELDHYESELRTVLRYRDFTRLERMEQTRLLEELLAANPFFIQAMVLDTDGRERVRVSSRDLVLPDTLRDRSQEPRFTQALAADAVYVSEVFIDEVRGEPVVSVSIPLPDLRSGQPAAILSVDTRLTSIWHLIAGLTFEPGSDIYLLDSAGRLVAHRNPSLVLRETHFNYRPMAELQTGVSAPEVVLADAQVSFGPQQFRVVAELEARHALRPAWEMLTIFVAVVLVTLVAAALLATLARRAIVDRLVCVSEAARAIAAGDLQRRVTVTGEDELGVLAASFNDMTQHLVQSLEQAHLGEEQFRQLAETVPQVVWLSDWGGAAPPDWGRYRMLYVSPLFERVWGRPVDEMYRNPGLWWEGIHPEDRERVRRLFFEQVAHDGYVCEYRVVRPGGDVRYIRDQGLPVRNATGQIYRVAGLAQDVTELHENERRLTRLNRALQTLSACNEALVRAVDERQLLQDVCTNLVTKGKYHYAAIHYLDGVGLAPQRAMECGMAWDDIAPATQEIIRAAQQQAIGTRQTATVQLADMIRDGSPRPAVTALVLVAEGALLGVLAVWGKDVIDQDELRLLRELADDLAFGIRSLRVRQERDRAELQIVQERDRARQYLQIAAVMIIALDERGDVVLLNRKGCELLGYTEDEALGLNWFETFVPAEMRDTVRDTFLQLMAGSIELTEHYENPVVTRNGEQRLISFYNNFVRDEGGRIVGTLSSGEDVTERARNQARLVRLTRALRTLSACNETLVRTTDEPALLAKICQLIIDTGGYQLAWIGYVEPAGGLRAVAQAGQGAELLSRIDAILAAGAIHQHQAMERRGYVRGAADEITAAEAAGSGTAISMPLIADHAVLGTLSVYSGADDAFDQEEVALMNELAADLAFGVLALRIRGERDQAEQSLRELNTELEQRVAQRTDELRRNEERFRITVASLAEGVIVTDIDGQVQLMNPEAERLLGWSQQDLVGRNLHDTVHVHAGDAAPISFADCPQHHAIAAGTIYHSDGETFRRRDGEVFPAALVAAPLRADERMVGAVVAFQDVSLRKEVERMKDDLISTVSHELRTPLTSLRGFVELMLMRDYPKERQREFLEIVSRETLRLNKLVDEFLDIQRMESGRQEYLMKVFSLGPLLGDIVGRYRQSDAQHHYQLVLANDLPDIVGDTDRLYQVMENLLSNAVKFSPDGGGITVSARRRDSGVEVRVDDHGIGIPAAALPHVFDKFYRVEQPADRPRVSGTGLGLPLVKEIVEAHGGTVGVESVYGEGSSFWFTLPLPRQGA